MQALANAGDRAHAIEVDVTDQAGLERAAKKPEEVFGALHVLVLKVEAWLHQDVTSAEDWQRAIAEIKWCA